jgi:hypothetical protein
MCPAVLQHQEYGQYEISGRTKVAIFKDAIAEELAAVSL